MLKASDLGGVQEDLARALIAYAVTEAPCLDRLPAADVASDDEAELRGRALSVLGLVAANAKRRGDPMLRGQRVGSAGVDYVSVSDSFTPENLAALRGICAALCDAEVVGLPLGAFPAAGVVAAEWAEGVVSRAV